MTIKTPETEDIPALQALWEEAFGDSKSFLDKFFATGFSPDRCHTLWRDGELVSALYWFDCTLEGEKIAYLYAIATAKSARGQGCCRALLEQTHLKLQEQGYVTSILSPANEGLFSLYEKLGYRRFCRYDRFSVDKSQRDTAKISPISPEEYGELRREYLPEGGVVQEGAALSYLGTYARFYHNPYAVCCVTVTENRAWFHEYLGAEAFMPAIISALGAEEGILRLPADTPGDCMYLPLGENAPVPRYFGLVLD